MLYTTYSGGTTAEKFKNYLESTLIPRLGENSIVIMDNMKSHHANDVKKCLDERKVNYLYLPPYSPDFNPIEKLWSKIKAFLRKLKARTPEQLPIAINEAFCAVTPSDCAGWFRFCNYLS